MATVDRDAPWVLAILTIGWALVGLGAAGVTLDRGVQRPERPRGPSWVPTLFTAAYVAAGAALAWGHRLEVGARGRTGTEPP